MNMRLLTIAFVSLMLAFYSCSGGCELSNPTCEDVPLPADCTAFYIAWYYDQDLDACEQIQYSGCEASGFATRTECEQCECLES